MIGFETIGNATLIAYDGEPVVATDPWLAGPAYFGSWMLAYEIPEAQLENIRACPFIWLSHGHPDHLSAESLQRLQSREQVFLLPDHVGKRIYRDLKAQGFEVRVLKDREWVSLSEHVRVMSLADYNQDATLLVDIAGTLVANFNDASARGWERVIKQIVRSYDVSFLLRLFGYGDADMINIWGEDGKPVLPEAAQQYPAGEEIQRFADAYGFKYVVPFSSFHSYQRTDSDWANKYTTPVTALADGFSSQTAELLSAFIRYDCVNESMEELRPLENDITLYEPAAFGDDWSEGLEKSDIPILENYFKGIQSINPHIDFINVRVGGEDRHIELAKRNFTDGITFEAPRHSLMTAVRYEVFDDMLIGNFMKTTLHGSATLYPYFNPYVAKYSDNGQVKTAADLKSYLAEYRKRTPPLHFALHRMVHSLETQSKQRVRRYLMDTFDQNSYPFRLVKKMYYLVKESTA